MCKLLIKYSWSQQQYSHIHTHVLNSGSLFIWMKNEWVLKRGEKRFCIVCVYICVKEVERIKNLMEIFHVHNVIFLAFYHWLCERMWKTKCYRIANKSTGFLSKIAQPLCFVYFTIQIFRMYVLLAMHKEWYLYFILWNVPIDLWFSITWCLNIWMALVCVQCICVCASTFIRNFVFSSKRRKQNQGKWVLYVFYARCVFVCMCGKNLYMLS